ncbi:hypothetical protein [Morganella morganii]|uniref:hypothetical protein n=1 Tax=Morganella morganii TaxID=582 RepID=UPI00339CB439
MKRKIIKRLIFAIPVLLLVKFSGIVDDILGSQFPLNIRNDGNNIKIHINDIKDSVVSVEATYLSKRCTTAHLNAAYTKISYSSDKISVDIDNIESSNGMTIFTVPISGGGWCNWHLAKIYITPAPRENTADTSTSIVINVTKTDNNYISYDVLLAPIVKKSNKLNDEFYYILSRRGVREISNNKSGNIYIYAQLKKELLTESLIDEGFVIFPNGKKIDYTGSKRLFFPEFDTILENSILKEKIILNKKSEIKK